MTELHRTWVRDVGAVAMLCAGWLSVPAAANPPRPSGPSLDAALQPAQFQLRGQTTLGMAPDMYLQHLNQLLREANLNFYARTPAPITPGEVRNVFSILFSDQVGLNGGVDKSSGEVAIITLIGQGDGSQESGMRIIMAAAAAFAAAVPNGSLQAITPEVIELANGNQTGQERSRVFNGVRLTYKKDPALGAVFTAEPYQP